MKADRDHQVPLSSRALAILERLAALRSGDFVFPGRSGTDAPVSGSGMEMLMRRMKAKPFTIHGFRSSFRDWAGDETHFAREVAEAALAHAVGDQSERAYRRGSAIAKRRELMQAWSNWLDGVGTHVTRLKREAA